MTKRLSNLRMGAIAACLAFSGQAMSQVATTQMQVHPRGATEQQSRERIDVRALYPNIAGMGARYAQPDRVQTVPQTLSKPAAKAQKRSVPVNFLAPPVPTNLWGNMVKSKAWTAGDQYGYYSFSTAAPITTFNVLGKNQKMVADGGSVIYDGVLHLFYLDTSMALFGGEVKAYHMQFDPETWEQVAEPVQVSLDLTTSDFAQDQATGTVYGQFYNSTTNQRELGVIDLENNTRTTFATTDKAYVTMGFSSDGYLYGIATDGNLYKIDKTNGAETLVGETGVRLLNDKDLFWNQSGEIDQETNTFYWAGVDYTQHSALYTVDLSTGAATKISEFPNNETFLGILLPKAMVAGNAPAAAEQLTAAFSGGSLTGSVKFKVPTKTYSGGTLNGAVTYTVTQEKNVLATGTAQPGEEVTANVTIPEEGLARLAVRLKNSAGKSKYTRCEQWVGYDEPLPAQNVKLEINNETGVANLTWDAPTSTVHNGYLGALSYDVVRYPDKVKVLTKGTDTHFTETLTKKGVVYYSYGVTVNNDKQVSQQKNSNGAILGDSVGLPYLEEFKTPAALNIFKIIDANNDGNTWEYNKYANWDPGTTGQSVTYHYSETNDGDDWLMTPPISLKQNFLYHFSFKTKSRDAKYKERLEVKFGKGDKVEDMTGELLAPTDVASKEYITYEKYFSVDADGAYRIGFHALSPKNQFFLYVDSISVEQGISFSAPDTVQNLTITPDPQGANKATITFTTPTLDIAGNALPHLTRLTVIREGKGVIKEVDYPRRGKQFTIEDEVENTGHVKYTVYCTFRDFDGRKLTKNAYIGLDTPEPPQNGRLTDLNNSIKIDWEPVGRRGKHGGIVVPERVSYQVYNIVYDPRTGNPSPEILDDTPNTTYSVTRNTQEGKQEFVLYALSATNDIGTSTLVSTSGLVVGEPYTLPIEESLAGSRMNLLWWSEHVGKTTIDITNDRPYDNDGGDFCFNAKAVGDEARMNSGKISLNGTKHPRIAFYHYSTPGKPIKLQVDVRKPDNTLTTVGEFDYATFSGQRGWQLMECDLDVTKFANEPYIQFSIHAKAGETKVPLWIDKISMRDVLESDLAAAISAPTIMTKGDTIRTSVRVNNRGLKPISDYKVRLTAGGELVKEVTATQALQPGQAANFEFDYKASAINEDSTVTLKAEAVYEADQNKEDNTAETTLRLKNSDLPKPENVIAEAKGGQSVQLKWAAPSITSETVTENFEDYSPWSIDTFGDWASIDGDKGNNGGFWKAHPYKHQGTPFAYIAFNPENLFAGCIASNPGLKPHSGDQFLAAVFSVQPSAGNKFVDADNWLISPLLSGEAQKIDFWANNYKAGTQDFTENVEILYSTTGRNQSDFQKVGDTHLISGGEFQNISADLPKGAKYFAIHHITGKDQVCLLMLDDVTFVKGYTKPKGYNVYRDGKLVAGLDAGTMTLDDQADADGQHRYAITAVYDNGESQPVWISVTTALQLIESLAGKQVDIYTIDGRLIGKDLNHLPHLERGIYVINGQKIVIK